MEDMAADDERERHWRIEFDENEGGIDDNNVLLHAKRWYVFMSEKKLLIKGGYSLSVSVYGVKMVL